MYGLWGITFFWAGDLLLDPLWERLRAWGLILAPMVMLLFLIWRCRIVFQAQAKPLGRKGLLVIGLANCITLCRGLLICCLGGFIFLPQRKGFLAWLPSIIYATASVADALDGLMARVRNEASPVGEVLDREVDALGTLVSGILSYQYGRVPTFYLPVSGAYYLFTLAIWFWTKHSKGIYPLQPSKIRRGVGTLQTLSLIFLLTPVLSPDAGFLFAVVLSPIVSFSFLRDWMAVVRAD
jgi:CDP-diacylglycerol---glycerol-3-phosphate 3-phosphatidyltransferase